MNDLGSFTAGMRAYRRGDFAEAAEALSGLLNRSDITGRLARYYCAMAYRGQGVAHAHAGQHDLAARRLRQAIALIGNQGDLCEYLLQVYARTGQYDLCAAQAEIIAEQDNRDVSARVSLALSHWRAGRREQAIMTLTAALRDLGDQSELHLQLGLLLHASDDLAAAHAHFKRAADCDCTNVRAWRCLALSAAGAGEYYRACQAFARAQALAPSDLMLSYHLCLAADAARGSGLNYTIRMSENVRPASASQIRQLAEYVAGEPDFAQAFLALPPGDADPELFGVLAAVLRTALAHHPDYADLQYFASQALARLGDRDAALVHARRAVEINARYVQALVHLAGLLDGADQRFEAIAALRQAMAAGADFADVHARLGELLQQAGMIPQARQHYGRALELNKKYQHAADRLRTLAA